MRNRLVKDSFLILATNVITYLATMINTRLISSSYSLVDYGYRAQILSIVTILVSVFSLGLSNCPNYFIPLSDKNNKYSAEKIVRNLYVSAFSVVLVMVFIFSVFYGGIVNYFKNDILYEYKIIIILMVAEQIFCSFYNGIQISQHRAIRATLTNLVRSLSTVVLTSIVCFTNQSIYIIILATLIIDCAFCVYTIIDSSHPTLKIGKWLDKKLISEMAKYCIPLGISSITAGLCAQIDKLFVARFFTPEDLAVYSNMCTELPLAAISGAFIAVISPYVVKLIRNNDSKQAIKLWGLVIEFVAIILFAIIATLITFSKQAIFILYSEKYLAGYRLFRIFILVEISRITYFGLILRSYGKSMTILMCSAMTLILNIVLNSISYFVFGAGLIGFALATMISTFAIQIIQLIMSCKVANVTFREIFPWRNLGIIGAINIFFSLAFGMITKLLNLTDSTKIVYFIPFGIVWILIYFVIEKKRLKELFSQIRNIEL